MTALRALITYDDLMRRFHHQLLTAPMGIEGALEFGFGFLVHRLRLQNVGLFWWDPQRHSLNMQYMLIEGELLEGEEEIIVDDNSPLRALVNDRQPVVVSKNNPWIAYIPLQSGSELLGVLRIERRVPLPKGKVLQSMTPILARKTPGHRQYPFLDDIADIFSLRLQQLTRDERHRKRTQYLQASAEVATAVFERPRLRDMLEAVSRSIVRNLGFDRIRVYLTQPDGSKLDGVLGLLMPDRLIDLTGESYPMKPGTNSLVDVVLASGKSSDVQMVGGRVVYVPLAVNNEMIGCIAVDNLLSQQLIDEDQMDSLRSLASQIGLAIVNARLFEDIEQQAITDGLTKLYVHRYFQQRLKEEIDRADRYSYSVALMMMDVDNFKTQNDRYGHLLGDKVLEFLSQTIRSNIRRIDLAARYGGDEVVLLLPEITEQEAWLMGERLLNALKSFTIPAPDGSKIGVSVTVGVALYPSDAHAGRDLVDAADKALYWAKRHNRGNICFYRNIAKNIEKSA